MSRYHKKFNQQFKEDTNRLKESQTKQESQTEEETQWLQKEFKNLRRLLENLLFQNGYDFSMTPSPANE